MAANLDSSYIPKEIKDVPVDPSAASKHLRVLPQIVAFSSFREDKSLMTEFAISLNFARALPSQTALCSDDVPLSLVTGLLRANIGLLRRRDWVSWCSR